MIFDQIKKLSNVLIKKIDKIDVESNKCLKVRAVTSSCTSCIDICPANSIEITQDSIEINESCLECGLCTTVCLTNALKWNDPPLIQLVNQLKQTSKGESEVYIACSNAMKGTVRANVVNVPCLGILPLEFWINAGLNVPNLKIIHQSGCCDRCKLSKGEKLFLEQKKEAELTIDHTFKVCTSLNEVQDDGLIDHNRRKFLTSIMEEAKVVNTITVKEVLEVDKALSPFEKFEAYYKQQDELEEMLESTEEIKNNVVSKLLNDSVIHTDKRTLLYQVFENEPMLQQQMTFLIPEIKESCTRCGACAFLCPTDALIMDHKAMILSPNKCVSCRLCVEICYEQHIELIPQSGTVFKDRFVYLLQ